MDRTERILSLIASLLNAREVVSVDTIRGWFPQDYAAISDQAFERKFERDKADIVELGIPLRFQRGEDGAADGYLVDRSETYLPELDFDAEELAALYIAGNGLLTQSEFPYHRDLERAMDKVALQVRPERVARARTAARRVLMNHPLQQRTPEVQRYLELASSAVTERRRLRLVYHTLYSGEVTEREVDAYGLRCWQGRWAIIGYCHKRQDVRLFSLHRIRELAAVDDAEPYEVPEGFSVAAWQTLPPWKFKMHAPLVARIACEPSRSWLVEEQLGQAPSKAQDAGPTAAAWPSFELEVTNSDSLVEWVLRQGPSVRVDAPDTLRQSVIEALRAVVANYDEASP